MGFSKLGVPIWNPYNKDFSILGSYWGPLILGNYFVQQLGLADPRQGSSVPFFFFLRRGFLAHHTSTIPFLGEAGPRT